MPSNEEIRKKAREEYEASIIPPTFDLQPGQVWDLIHGRLLKPGEMSGGTIRYVANDHAVAMSPCMACDQPIVRGQLVDEDLVIGHSNCF